MSRPVNYGILERSAFPAKVIDMGYHYDTILDREAEQGNESDRGGNVECHSPNRQGNQTSEKRHRQQRNQKTGLPELSECAEQQQEHKEKHERDNDQKPSVRSALVLELTVPAYLIFRMVENDGLVNSLLRFTQE